MNVYSVYFLVSGRIRARQDFATDNNVDAIRIARLLYDACSDCCESFELWEGDRIIFTRPPPYRGTSFAGLAWLISSWSSKWKRRYLLAIR